MTRENIVVICLSVFAFVVCALSRIWSLESYELGLLTSRGGVGFKFEEIQWRRKEAREEWSGTPSPIDNLKQLPNCVYPQTSNITNLLTPMQRHGSISYVLPPPSERNLLTPRHLDDSAVFLFVHMNKAGGTLIKEEVFKPAARAHKWDGVGYGTLVGWSQLLQPCKPRSGYTRDYEALVCGSPAQLSPCGPVGGGNCPLRLIWGTKAFGLCGLYPLKPCVMTIVLRHPVDRMISQYNYVCVDGMEGQKKWLDSWKAMGRCPLTLLQFVDSDLTSKTFLIDHFARAADPNCGLDIALLNLRHPCLRFLLLSRLQDGLKRLADTWGPRMKPFLDRVADRSTKEKKNHSPMSDRTRLQLENPEIMKELREKLRIDIEFYEKAIEFYEVQWDQPLESCNPR